MKDFVFSLIGIALLVILPAANASRALSDRTPIQTETEPAIEQIILAYNPVPNDCDQSCQTCMRFESCFNSCAGCMAAAPAYIQPFGVKTPHHYAITSLSWYLEYFPVPQNPPPI